MAEKHSREYRRAGHHTPTKPQEWRSSPAYQRNQPHFGSSYRQHDHGHRGHDRHDGGLLGKLHEKIFGHSHDRGYNNYYGNSYGRYGYGSVNVHIGGYRGNYYGGDFDHEGYQRQYAERSDTRYYAEELREFQREYSKPSKGATDRKFAKLCGDVLNLTDENAYAEAVSHIQIIRQSKIGGMVVTGWGARHDRLLVDGLRATNLNPADMRRYDEARLNGTLGDYIPLKQAENARAQQTSQVTATNSVASSSATNNTGQPTTSAAIVKDINYYKNALLDDNILNDRTAMLEIAKHLSSKGIAVDKSSIIKDENMGKKVTGNSGAELILAMEELKNLKPGDKASIKLTAKLQAKFTEASNLADPKEIDVSDASTIAKAKQALANVTTSGGVAPSEVIDGVQVRRAIPVRQS